MSGVVGTDKRGGAFLIRPYRPEDRAGLDAMFESFTPKRAAQGLPPGDDRLRSRWLDRVLARGHHLVVEVDGRLVGHGMLIPFTSAGPPGDGRAELANFLHQSVRDRGIGTALNRARRARALPRAARTSRGGGGDGGGDQAMKLSRAVPIAAVIMTGEGFNSLG